VTSYVYYEVMFVSNHPKIRIAYVIATLDDFGAERQLVSLVTRLDPRRFEVSVYTLMREGERLPRILDEARIHHECLNKKRKYSPGVLIRLRQRFLRQRPHITHTWLFTSNAFGRTAAILAGVPYIVASERAEDPWKGYLHRFVDRTLARATHAIVANSRAVEMAVRNIVGPVVKILVIPNGIEIPEFSEVRREDLGADQEDVLCLFAGRLEPQKNVSILLRAFRAAQANDKRLRLLIAGEGVLRRDLENLSQSLHLGPRVRFLGYREDLPGIMKTADLLILPSLWEGMPNVLIEAQILELPILASRIPSITEWVEEGSEGLLFDPKNQKELTRRILEGTSNLPHMKSRARRVRQRALKYDMRSMVSRYEEIYLELAGTRSNDSERDISFQMKG